MTTVPYISGAAFRAHPTFLDLDSLRVGSTLSADQEAELTNILLMSSEWADNECNQPLHAHTFTQQGRSRTDRAGTLSLLADHGPVIAVTSVSYGSTPTALSTIDGANAWIEGERNILIPLQNGAAWSGSLQFGPPTSSQVYTRTIYSAGFVATLLSSAAAAGATTLTVADPTGIEPGQTYRIWEPGAEESVTVSPDWVPPASTVPPMPTAVTLASPTLRDHEAEHDFSRMPSDIRLAVTLHAISQLQRPDTTAEDDYPDTALSASLRGGDSRRSSTGLVREAARILASYGRIR